MVEEHPTHARTCTHMHTHTLSHSTQEWTDRTHSLTLSFHRCHGNCRQSMVLNSKVKKKKAQYRKRAFNREAVSFSTNVQTKNRGLLALKESCGFIDAEKITVIAYKRGRNHNLSGLNMPLWNCALFSWYCTVCSPSLWLILQNTKDSARICRLLKVNHKDAFLRKVHHFPAQLMMPEKLKRNALCFVDSIGKGRNRSMVFFFFYAYMLFVKEEKSNIWVRTINSNSNDFISVCWEAKHTQEGKAQLLWE